jgi:hypothetical protein
MVREYIVSADYYMKLIWVLCLRTAEGLASHDRLCGLARNLGRIMSWRPKAFAT